MSKSLKGFDFYASTGLNKKPVLDLAWCDFVVRRGPGFAAQLGFSLDRWIS